MHDSAGGGSATARRGSEAGGGEASGQSGSNATGGGSSAGPRPSGTGSGAEASSEGGHRAAHVATPLRVSGGGSAQFRTQGGDNSVQDFGQESSESELREAGEALHGFLVARTNEEWSRACSYLPDAMAKQLEGLVSQSQNGENKSCASALAGLTPPLSTSVRREQTVVDAASLRREGEHGFLIYRGEEGGHSTVYAISMVLEGGGWKVAVLAPVPLD
jgi:hypothetical protein